MGTHPRERVRTATITTPANTAIVAAISTDWTVGRGVVERVDIVIPAGHAGLTGIQLLWGGRQMVPYDGAEFLSGNDDEITVELGLWVQTGILVVRTFNTDDTFAHAFLLRAYVTDLELAPELVLAPMVPAVPVAEAPMPEEFPPPEEFGDAGLAALADELGMDLEDLVSVLDDILAELQVQGEQVADLAAGLEEAFAGVQDALTALQENVTAAVSAVAGATGAPAPKLAKILKVERKILARVKAKPPRPPRGGGGTGKKR